MGKTHLTEVQSAALWAAYQCWLSRCSDGLWRRVDQLGPKEAFKSSDIRLLQRAGLLELLPIGAFITGEGCDHLLMFGGGGVEPLGLLSRARENGE